MSSLCFDSKKFIMLIKLCILIVYIYKIIFPLFEVFF